MISIKSQCVRVSTAKTKILITYSLISDSLLRDYHKSLFLSNVFNLILFLLTLYLLFLIFHMISCIPHKRTAISMGFPDHLIFSAKIRNALSRTDLPLSPYHDIIRHVNKSARKRQMILYICACHSIISRYHPLLVSYL